MNELEGEINGFGARKLVVEDWKERSNQALKKQKIPYKVVSSTHSSFLQVCIGIFLIFMVILGSIFIYMVSEGKLRDEITQPIDNQVNSTTQNEYSFNQDTYNKFNNTFNFEFQLNEEFIQSYCNCS